jgi:hypothetical protein
MSLRINSLQTALLIGSRSRWKDTFRISDHPNGETASCAHAQDVKPLFRGF